MQARVTRLASMTILALLITAAWGGSAPTAAAGRTFTVDTVSDVGDVNVGDGRCDTSPKPNVTRCSLRAAIEEANADAAQDRIGFGIAGTGTKTITPNSQLPAIAQPLVIDGYTQPGARPNTASAGTNATLRVQVDGRFVREPGFVATVPVTIRGLAIYWFGRGIELGEGADGSRIMGNFIGTDVGGSKDRGVDAEGVLVDAKDVRIGSNARGDRNLISGNTTSGIGLGPKSRGARIQNNLIGTKRSGANPLPNEGHGILVDGSSGHLIGGDTAAVGNVIAFNGGRGVNVVSNGDQVPANVRILSNSMSRNRSIAIDLGGDGTTPNDGSPDADRGPNGLQNFPKMVSATLEGGGTTIKGTLTSRPRTKYLVQVFSAVGGDPEGRVLLASVEATTNSKGQVSFTVATRALSVGQPVLATATDVERRQTSEFSRITTVQ